MKVTLLIPTLDEIDGMREIMPKIKKEWVDQIIIVDGGSMDGTVEYVKENNYFLVQQKAKGLFNAYKEAMEFITGDIVVTFTPDGNSLPELIPVLIEKMKEGYDMVIVSRYLNGAKSYDDDIVTAFGNWMFTRVINVLFGGHYTDTLVGFRAWKRDLFKLTEQEKDIFSFEPYSSVKCAKLKLKVTEIPGDEPPRLGGKRKMRPLVDGFHVISRIIQELFDRA